MANKGIESFVDGTSTPRLVVQFQISDNTYDPRGDSEVKIIVRTTLESQYSITVDTRGKWNSELGTILVEGFRLRLFNWYDTTIDIPLIFSDKDERWGCEDGLGEEHCLQLIPREPIVTTHSLDDASPLSDPLSKAVRVGNHSFRLTLMPQTLKWTELSKKELFKDGKSQIPLEDYKTWKDITLASTDKIKLNII